MTSYTITGKNIHEVEGVNLAGRISLPSSKSISNRLLIIRALARSDFQFENLSKAEDTLLLQELLKQIESAQPNQHISLNCCNAGTVMRFLVAYLAIQPGTWLLSGSERMQRRPIGILVEALRSLGAEIDYEGIAGYPPLRIIGRQLSGGEVTVDVSVSSQFVSALLLIAPLLPEGLTIRMVGDQVSFPYVDMTLRIMEEFGAVIKRNEELLLVKHGSYQAEARLTEKYTVEADWSSAAFWYEAAALAGSAELTLPGLHKNSLQGDAVLAELFRPLGVETVFESDGIRLISGKWAVGSGQLAVGSWQPAFDLAAYPDLAPSLIVTYAVLGIAARFTGLHHLKTKESDRLEALVKELGRLQIDIRHPAFGIIETDASQSIDPAPGAYPQEIIKTYSDHRIAMAFALLAIRTGTIRISDPAVVAKSYPGFWEEMGRLGFEVSET